MLGAVGTVTLINELPERTRGTREVRRRLPLEHGDLNTSPLCIVGTAEVLEVGALVVDGNDDGPPTHLHGLGLTRLRDHLCGLQREDCPLFGRQGGGAQRQGKSSD